jgi:GH25 family lysozyme M1 (1,4-beta-N-acetylmuramidase)
VSPAKRRNAALAAAVSATLFATVVAADPAHAQSPGRRAVGIDVSDWQEQNAQGHINRSTVAAPVAQGGAGMQFAFIRSSRGGTTGTYDEHTTQGTLSHRYDDYEWVYNITNATANGVLAGPYHFARPDILTNTGADEADHMIQQAGAWMSRG